MSYMDAIQKQIEVVRGYQAELFGPFHVFPKSPDGVRYDFSFSYCGKALTWGIMYDLGNLSFAPDFIIPTEPETLFVPLSQFVSFQSYDVQNPDSLLKIIYELLDFYTNYQKGQVKDHAHERVQFQFSVIESERDIKFFWDRPESEVRFMVPLGIDVASELGTDGLEYPRKEAFSLVLYLLLVFKDRNTDGKLIPDTILLAPPSIKKFISKFQKIPQWTESTIIVDYLDQYRTNLKNYIHTMKLRKNFLLACIGLFGSALEYDSVHFSRVSFFFHDCEAVAYFTLTDNFPEKQPAITLQSLTYHKGSPQKAIQALFDSYPYSPRWPADELARRIRSFLIEKKFKDFCAEESSKEEKSRS